MKINRAMKCNRIPSLSIWLALMLAAGPVARQIPNATPRNRPVNVVDKFESMAGDDIAAPKP